MLFRNFESLTELFNEFDTAFFVPRMTGQHIGRGKAFTQVVHENGETHNIIRGAIGALIECETNMFPGID